MIHWNISNSRKLLIAFVGIPGCGKTLISKALENNLKGIRINSIDIQNYIEELQKDIKYSDMIIEKREYIMWLMSEIAQRGDNKLIILDKGIERTYEEIKKWADENGYQLLVISLTSPIEVIKARLMEREGENAVNYFRELERWEKEYNVFMSTHEVNLLLDTSSLSPKECVAQISSLL